MWQDWSIPKTITDLVVSQQFQRLLLSHLYASFPAFVLSHRQFIRKKVYYVYSQWRYSAVSQIKWRTEMFTREGGRHSIQASWMNRKWKVNNRKRPGKQEVAGDASFSSSSLSPSTTSQVKSRPAGSVYYPSFFSVNTDVWTVEVT